MRWRKNEIKWLFLAWVVPVLLTGQDRTVGVFDLMEDAQEGFTLFSPSVNNTVYLINNCGQLVHSWECTTRPGSATYLQPDGSLYRAGRLNNLQIHAGGAGGLIEQYDWEGELEWSFVYNSPEFRAHHDFQVLPNGNVLLLAWEKKEEADCLANGRDPALLSDGELWPEHIVEIEPVGADSGTIVWEWHAWDHLIQDYDASKANYGVVSDHPEKIDLNYVAPGQDGADWQHANSIHYHAELDQIMISVLYFDEIWIIDHNTTTAEAAGPQGDLLYRWGNPRAYGQGEVEDQQFFGQHSAHWIAEGLPDAGKVMVFNNGLGRPDSLFSTVVKLDPVLTENGYALDTQDQFLPLAPTWEYVADPPTSFFSRFVSGAQQLSNGNIMITDGAHGTFLEINPANELVWKYVSPVTIFGIATQGNSVVNPIGDGINSIFRATKFEPDYAAFAGRDLSPGEPLEIDPDITPCLVSAVAEKGRVQPDIFPNPAREDIRIEGYEGPFQLLDLMGRPLIAGRVPGQLTLDIRELPAGVYVLQLTGHTAKIVVQ